MTKKEVNPVLVCRRSTAVLFTPSLLQNLVTGLIKIFSNFLIEILWISLYSGLIYAVIFVDLKM